MRTKSSRLIFAVAAVMVLFSVNSMAQSSTARMLVMSRLQHHGHTAQFATKAVVNEHGTEGWRFVSIDVPGAVATITGGINPRGDIVGVYYDASFDEHGFLLKDGKVTTIDVPGSLVGLPDITALQTEANGINPEGDIVGDYFAPPGAPLAPECIVAFSPACRRGFLYHKGQFSDVLVPGKKGSIPNAISPNGAIYGCDHDDDYFTSMFGFVRTPSGSFKTLNAGGGELRDPTQSVPVSMNNGATPDGSIIVGLYLDLPTKTVHGYIVQDGVFRRYDVPGSVLTQNWGINPKGDFVGLYDDPSGNEHGFLQRGDDDDPPITIDVPSAPPFNAVLTDAFAINSEGAIVGLYMDASGNLHGYLAVREKD